MSSDPAGQMALFSPTSDDTAMAKRRPRVMSAARRAALRLCVLGSGSGGNSTVVRLGNDAMLIDAGFGPRTTNQRLNQAGLDLADIKAICLTHMDRDHFRPTWMRAIADLDIVVFVHRFHRAAFEKCPGADRVIEAGLLHEFDGDGFVPLAGMDLTPLRFLHDMQGTSGFRIDSEQGAIGYATDLGRVPGELIERFVGVDVLCLESNYDPGMQQSSPRPVFLKRRIMGGRGHLSNEEAFEAVRLITQRSGYALPRHVVLLHRSQQCNHPTCVRRVFERDPAILRRITLTEQRRRSRWIDADSGRRVTAAQMGLAFG